MCSRISFKDVKVLLADSRNTALMTLIQYWMAYAGFASRRDEFALKSLRDNIYVVLLDTMILNRADIKNSSSKAVLLKILAKPPY